MRKNPSCKHCKILLKPNMFNNQTWFNCPQCTSSYVPISTFMTILSEFEFNKFIGEIRNAQIRSSEFCSSCARSMIKVINLAGSNQVEVCPACQLVWLDPSEGAKIKTDQQNLLSAEFKVSVPSHEMRGVTGAIKKVVATTDTGIPLLDNEIIERKLEASVVNGATNKALDVIGYDEISKKHPMLGTIIGLAILIFLVYLIKLI
ncbi:MAG: hypothetical protein ACXVAX_13930 [Pseudobdellovibrio sp.]